MEPQLEWGDHASELLLELLAEFPTEDRNRVKDEAGKAAERVAKDEGISTINEDHVLMGLMIATPPFLRDGISKALEARGYDVSSYTKLIEKYSASDFWG